MRSNNVKVMLMILLLATPILTSTANAQEIFPRVTLDCQEGVTGINVEPGSNAGATRICIAKNPTMFTEKVSIDVDSDYLYSAHPDEISIGPGSTVSFVITVRGETSMAVDSINVVVEAVVIEYNGLPPITEASAEDDFVVEILPFAYACIDTEQYDLTFKEKETIKIQYSVVNCGNVETTFYPSFEIEELEDGMNGVRMEKTLVEELVIPIKHEVVIEVIIEGKSFGVIEYKTKVNGVFRIKNEYNRENDIDSYQRHDMEIDMQPQAPIISFSGEETQENSAVFITLGSVILGIVAIIIVVRSLQKRDNKETENHPPQR